MRETSAVEDPQRLFSTEKPAGSVQFVEKTRPYSPFINKILKPFARYGIPAELSLTAVACMRSDESVANPHKDAVGDQSNVVRHIPNTQQEAPFQRRIEELSIHDIKEFQATKVDTVYRVAPDIKREDFGPMASVYEVRSRPITIAQADRIANALGIDAQAYTTGDKNVWTTKNTDKWLEVHPKLGVVYYQTTEPVTGPRTVKSEQDAAKIAQDFLVDNNLLGDQTVKGVYRSKPIDVDHLYYTRVSKDANSYEVVFGITESNIPVVTPNIPIRMIEGSTAMIVGYNGKIMQISYVSSGDKLDEIGNYPIRGRDQGLADLASGYAKLTSLIIGGVDMFTGEGVGSVTDVIITSFKPVYVDQGSNRIGNRRMPYYEAKGIANVFGTPTIKGSKNAEVTFLVPAIGQKYLLPAVGR